MNAHQINELNQAEFTQIFGPLYEESPWVAAETWVKRPFNDTDEFLADLNKTMREASRARQMELICAHPELAGRFLQQNQLTESSQEEQKSAGLTSLTPEQAEQFAQYNEQYKNRFHFPFIICAKLNRVETILAAFQIRLQNTTEQEFQTALGEIEKIAKIRLEKLLSN